MDWAYHEDGRVDGTDQPVAFCVPRVPGGGDLTPFLLPCRPCRVCRSHVGAEGLQKRGHCIGCSSATVGKVIGQGMYQFGILLDVM